MLASLIGMKYCLTCSLTQAVNTYLPDPWEECILNDFDIGGPKKARLDTAEEELQVWDSEGAQWKTII